MRKLLIASLAVLTGSTALVGLPAHADPFSASQVPYLILVDDDDDDDDRRRQRRYSHQRWDHDRDDRPRFYNKRVWRDDDDDDDRRKRSYRAGRDDDDDDDDDD